MKTPPPDLVSRNLDLLFEAGSLRHIQRSWRQFFGVNVANDLEHTIRVQYIALMLAQMEKKGDHGTILKMALLHDLAEARTGDQNFVHKKYGDLQEEAALHGALVGTSLEEDEALITRYIKRDCIESKLVKDADNLDVDIEMRELAAQGHQLPAKWHAGRKNIRDTKPFTESAKILWDAIQESDPYNWQVQIH